MVQASQQALPTQVQLSDRQRTILLAVARRSLVNNLVRHLLPEQAVEDAVRQVLAQGLSATGAGERDQLLAQGACFVTLWQRDSGELRGCRGECRAHQPLVAAVGFMALATALDDPRFAAVTAGELAELRIEISVLTPLYPIESAADRNRPARPYDHRGSPARAAFAASGGRASNEPCAVLGGRMLEGRFARRRVAICLRQLMGL